MRSVRRSICAAMLTLQAIVLFLFGVASIGLSDLGAARSLEIGGGLALLCLLAAGLLGRGGYTLGWLIQVLSIGLGFAFTAMFALGVVFGSLWAGAYFMGTTIDREKAERAVLEEQWRAEHGTGA